MALAKQQAAQTQDIEQLVASLDGAEAFLQCFEVSYQPALLQAKRVVYLRLLGQLLEKKPATTYQEYQAAVAKAYCLLEKGVVVAHAAPACSTCKGC
ncbi:MULTISPECIES: nitrogenase-stabilizing/protective protein NifW [unclassified Agarivorans]|uniref:nitrogenase-stabilizing/protective protein NifW n=1 Tax=unclassified Agarivorans TaxID=2636026 RepID=UPI003D7E41F6